jgi:hypothetical protein
VEPEHLRAAFLLRADQAVRFAAYSGPIDEEIVEAAKAAASAWIDLRIKLMQRLKADGETHDESDAQVH